METSVIGKKVNTKFLSRDLSGQTFGRWTVLDKYITSQKNERKWLCRCSCGSERYVLERSLLYSGSKSCGCLRKERAAEAVFTDLTGKIFGDLTVLCQVENTSKISGTMWLCRCSCGAEYKVLATLLINGRRTRCSSKEHEKNYAFTDITGRKFNKLTALYRTKTSKRNSKGVVWRCRCECGNEIDIAYNELVHCNTISCGCRKKEHDQELKNLLIHVDRTSVDMIKSKKVPTNNTTGYRGVYLVKGKYTAKIVFQKKQFHLGNYNSAEEAAQARQEAEELLFDGTVAFYEKWHAKAEKDPEWAAQNPVKISVMKSDSKGITVNYFPADLQ